jgi:hypothetical protein
MFPAAFPKQPTAATVQTARTNKAFAGWNVTISNLFFANGQRDPWRYSTMSAPGVITQSTTRQPIAEGEGYHCADLCTPPIRFCFMTTYAVDSNPRGHSEPYSRRCAGPRARIDEDVDRSVETRESGTRQSTIGEPRVCRQVG